MSSSKLGELPDFGPSRGLSSQSDSSQLGLDDALDSLLGDSANKRSDKKHPKKNKAKAKANPSSSRLNDAEFYSQLGGQADLDDDEDMVDVTPVDTKKMADSVDVDNMEASLFGSFSRSQNQRRQLVSMSRKASGGPSPSTGAEGKGTLPADQGRTEETSAGDVELAQPLQGKGPIPSEKEKPQAKKYDFDDDILDLLSDSDSEDKAPKKRVKPKIQLTTNPKRDEPTDSKPITSSTTTTEHTESDVERPKTSHGRQSQSETIPSSQPPEKSGKIDVLKLDSTPDHPSNGSKSPGQSFNSTAIEFGDDDDDILSGMGFDDSSSKPNGTAKRRRGSRLDELLGKKTAVATAESENSQSTRLTEASAGDTKNSDEDGFQFGGYVPSATTADHATNLPGTRRRRNSDSLTSRPNSAPGSGKKSVRFAEAAENDSRPSSSPAVNDTPKPALKGSRRASSQDQDSETKDGSSTSSSRKPPLPRKSEPTDSAPSDQGQSEMTSTLPQDNTNKIAAETHAATGEESLTDNNDSLFPWHESTPKQPSSRTRGRRPSQQRSMASSLFEESHERPTGDQDEFPSIGNQSHTQENAPKLERPTFPWQKGRKSRSHSTGAIGGKDTTDISTTNRSLESSQQPPPDQGSLIASFQEQLLQQQKQMQEQLKTLQSHQPPIPLKGGSAEEEGLNKKLKTAQKQIQEVEKLVEEQKSELSAKQVLVEELQIKLQSSEEGHKRLEVECKALNDKMNDIESGHQKVQLYLQSQLEELKMKLYKVELERDQLKQSIETSRIHHTEEMESVQKSHDARIKAMEDSFQRRETRWREEAELESVRYQERLQQLEKEKTDAVLALKKKIDALEVSKTNEIGRLQDIHYSSVEDLKREHELDKQHLLSLHRQEVEALKAAHSHTRMLSDLSRQVESSTREVSQLQAKLENTHSKEMQDQVQRAKTQEQQLKTLEERLLRQQAENSSERERLQSLIAKLEVTISQQRKQIEQEHWELQQESNHLKVQQKAFEEERLSSLRRIEEDKETLQQAKERFLTEQREVLTKCYEERRALATERAEVTVLQKRMQEKEQLASTKNLKVEAEYEATLTQIREESARITSEARQLKQDQQIFKVNQDTLNKDIENLDRFNAELQRRSQEIEEMHQSAVTMRENGEQALIEARRLQDQLAEQSRNIQSQWAELREKETRIATELLSLAHQRRELQQLQHGSRLSAVPSTESVHSLDPLLLPPPPIQSSELTPSHSSLSLLHPPHTRTLADQQTVNLPPQVTLGTQTQSTVNPPVPSLAEHRNSVSYSYDLSHRRLSVKAKLAALEQSRSLRSLQFEARKDKEVLEEENEFLESIHHLQSSTVKQLIW